MQIALLNPQTALARHRENITFNTVNLKRYRLQDTSNYTSSRIYFFPHFPRNRRNFDHPPLHFLVFILIVITSSQCLVTDEQKVKI